MTKNEAESKLQRRCQKIIKDSGAFVFKTHGNIYTRTGIPDLIACIPVTHETLKDLLDDGWFKHNKVGVFVGLEIKRANRLNELSKAQEIVGEEIRNAGGVWYAIDDSDLVSAIVEAMKGRL